MELSFIAEISGNHNGNLERALEIVRAAADSGATHVKIQTYTPDSITLNSSQPAYRVDAGHVLWGGKTLYELYQGAYTPYEWHSEIFSLTRKLGMVPFSTPFDESAVGFLETFDLQLFKIASLEIVDLPLIKRVAETKKPLIISTGTATLEEVDEAVGAAHSAGCQDLTLLVCTSDYPADPKLANLARIPFLRDRYDCHVGISDHSMGTHVALAAIALGASVVEKHITLDRNDGGVDSAFSATPEEFKSLVLLGREVESAVGLSSSWGLAEEGQSRRHRPSIIITKDIRKGELLTQDNIATLRPNIGLPPKFMDLVLGMRAIADIERGSGLRESDVEND
tara:strand:+ start:241 stop:1257 length:1017 start_codon:yes stop_codon:yes gene_type:complete